MRLQITTTAVACLTLLSQLHANDVARTEEPRTKEQVERVFDSIDRDRDDRISKQEGARAEVIRNRFDGVDADQDGYVSRSEYRARPTNEPFE